VKNKAHTALLASSAFWCLSIVLAPFANWSSVYDFFSAICHQDPARSWFIFGEPLPVCIRCASIYFGFLASLSLTVPGKVTWLRVSIMLTLAEFAIARLFYDTAVLRCLSGFLLGITAAPFVREGVEQMLGRSRAAGGAGAGM